MPHVQGLQVLFLQPVPHGEISQMFVSCFENIEPWKYLDMASDNIYRLFFFKVIHAH